MNIQRNSSIRVLAVDDSAVMRGVLRTLFLMHAERPLDGLPRMELCGVVEDGVECLAAVLRLKPDVVVLDLEMPRMHGLDVLERLRVEEPGLPVIMCSSYTERGARSTLDALALGAADYVMKPREQGNLAASMEKLLLDLLPKIAALAGSRTTQRAPSNERQREVSRNVALDQAAPTPAIVVIAVSTGGPSALEQVLPALPPDFSAPILIVQHMPKLFTGALAERLDRLCALHVQEAHEGCDIKPGTIILAPGDAHMEITEIPSTGFGRSLAGQATRKVIHLHQQRALNGCKPSADYLFTSAARIYGPATLALVMTGMGSDGVAGARCVHDAGGLVLVQDAATSAVWGMPGRVFEAGIAPGPLPLHAIAHELAIRVGAASPTRSSLIASRIPGPKRAESHYRTGANRLPRNEVAHGLL